MFEVVAGMVLVQLPEAVFGQAPGQTDMKIDHHHRIRPGQSEHGAGCDFERRC